MMILITILPLLNDIDLDDANGDDIDNDVDNDIGVDSDNDIDNAIDNFRK